MPTYTIHAPPQKIGTAVGGPEGFIFVRDGFHFWAFALAPVWLLLRRLWLAFAIYVIGYGFLSAGIALLGGSMSAQLVVGLLVALLIGLEAPSIWRWTLTRRGWTTLGFVVGEDAEIAEQRFFTRWVQRAAEIPAPQTTSSETKYSVPISRGSPSASDVIGLFPEPGGQR